MASQTAEVKEAPKTSKKEEPKKENYETDSRITLLFFAAAIFHLFDVASRLRTVEISLFNINYIGYLVFGLLASLICDRFSFKTLSKNILLFTGMYLAPLLFQFISFNSGLSIQFSSALVSLGLIFSLPLYFSLIRGNHRTQVIGTVYLFILLILFIGANWIYARDIIQVYAPDISIDAPGVPLAMTLSYVRKDIIFDGIIGLYDLLKESTISFFTGTINYAIEPFQGKVERGSKEKLGVYLSDFRTFSSSYREGDEAVFNINLYAKSLDFPVDLSLKCILDPEAVLSSNNFLGKIYPKQSYKGVLELEEIIECSFDKISAGEHDILFSAKVSDFTTSAYLKGYFINEETLRTLKSRGIEPLDSFKLSDKSPTAVYTKGPLEVGMELSSKPFISLKENTDFILRISLRNLWSGKLNSISEIYLIVPSDIDVTEFSKTKNQERKSCTSLPTEFQPSCTSSESVYEFSGREIGDINSGEYGTLSFRAKMNIKNSQQFLKNQQFTEKYFKVIAKYDYEVSEKTSFFAEPSPA